MAKTITITDAEIFEGNIHRHTNTLGESRYDFLIVIHCVDSNGNTIYTKTFSRQIQNAALITALDNVFGNALTAFKTAEGI